MAVTNEIIFKARGLRELQKELADVRTAMESATDPTQMAELASAAKKLEDELIYVNENLDLMAAKNQALGNINRQFGQMGDSLSRLDFASLSKQADAFAKSAKGISFKGAIASVKSLGSTFIQVGRALLTNPLFLLATVIVAIVTAIYKLLDSLGLVQKALDLLKKPLQIVTDLFYKLTDAIGLTNKAEIEATAKVADAWEKRAKTIESASRNTIQVIDHEIRMLQLEGKSTEEAEARKRVEIEETAKTHLIAAEARLKAAKVNKDIDEAEVKALEEALEQTRLHYQQTLLDTKYYETKIAQEKADKLKKEEFDKQQARMKSAEDRRRENEKRILEEKRAYEERQKALFEQQTMLMNFEMDNERLKTDLRIELMEEGTEKQIALNAVRYERIIEDTKNKFNELIMSNMEDAENLLKQRDEIIAYYNQLALDKEIKFYDDLESAKKRAESEAENHLMLTMDDVQRNIQILENETNGKLEVLRADYANRLIDKELFESAKTAIENDHAEKRLEIERQATIAKIALANQYVGAVSTGLESIGRLTNAIYESEINNAEGNSAKQEELRKKQFKAEKAFQISMAVINTAQGILSGLGSPWPMNIIQPILAGITGVAQIATIKATKYSGGSSSGSVSMPKSQSITNPQRSMPNVNFTGTGGNTNVNASGNIPPSNEISIDNTIIVSESEITNKQNKVAKIIESAKI